MAELMQAFGTRASEALKAAGGMLAALAQFSSETRLYDIEIEGCTAPLAVEGFTAQEGLCEIYRYEVLALSTDALIDLDALIWKPTKLWLTHSDGSRHQRSGFIRAAEALESDGGLARYSFTLVPWLWLATQQTHSRIYQQQRLPAIIEDVLAAYASDADWQLAEGVQAWLDALPPRRVCTQYRETDHAFLLRLLTEEGLGYYFEELADGGRSQRLVIFGDSTRFTEDPASLSGLGGAGIRFHRHSSQQDQDSVQTLHAVRRLPSSLLTAAAWSPDSKRIVAASTGSAQPATTDTALPLPALERYHWAGHGTRVSTAELERSAELAQQAVEARHKTFEGSGTVRSFRPGHFFTLTDSPYEQAALFRTAGTTPAAQSGTLDAEERTRFALTQVRSAGINNLPGDLHQAVSALLGRSASDALTAAENGDSTSVLLQSAREQGYACEFECLRSLIPWRPERAGERRGAPAEGPQSAIVVGVPGAESDVLYRDAQGRIQVRFHWQLGETPQDQSSGWLRLTQRYAGSGIGASFVPRIGQEVLVGFVDHDIDQPIVLGALYNGRGEGGDAPTPGGRSTDAGKPQALFAQAADLRASAQGNTRGGNAPAWHGASPDAEGHRNAAGFIGTKTQALGGDGFNQLQFDDHDGELRSQLATTQSASQLNLGHLIHTADNHRGSQRGMGFELRSDQSTVIRGGAGVLLTTWHDVPAGSAAQPIGELTGPLALLNQAKGLSESFDTASKIHKTVGVSAHRGSTQANASALIESAAPMAALLKAAGALVHGDDDGQALTDAQKSLAESSAAASGGTSIPHLGAPIVIGAGRGGLALTAEQAIQVASGDTALYATGGDLNLASGQQITLHSSQAIGLLAGAAKAGEKGMGLSAIAAQGPMRIEAQNSTLNLDSEKALQIVSVNAMAEFAAAKSIKLSTAGGASIEIEGGNITVQCPGTLTVHAAQHQFTGPTQLSREMNAWPVTKFDERIKIAYSNGDPAKNYKYELLRADGAKISGVTDDEGWTTLQKATGLEELVIKLLGPVEEPKT